ncbi:unnamed protein product [Pleuronectes platessa]|uniref:Teneurin-1-4-like galactose-binding domain-containing protein n=1 Tax=Pleuronectes platessa TaxID=8262 RepID=A0A9N7U4W5_PLEPL|nr:unnamed protein product [Pleuronectes platessa]
MSVTDIARGLTMEEKWVRGRAIDRGEVDVGTQQSQAIPPGLFWRFHMTVHHPTYIKFNLSLSHNALLGGLRTQEHTAYTHAGKGGSC